MAATCQDAPVPAPAAGPAHPEDEAGLVGAIRRLERATGLYRPGRSPWVWVLGPGANLAGTVGVVTWVGLLGGLGLAITVPLAVFCGLAMGAMAWAFIGNAWEQEEDERRAAEARAGGGSGPTPPGAGRSGGPRPG